MNLRQVPVNAVSVAVRVMVVKGEGQAVDDEVTTEVVVSCLRRRPKAFSKLFGAAWAVGKSVHASTAIDRRRPSMNFIAKRDLRRCGWRRENEA